MNYNSRIGYTTVGCYHDFIPSTYDAMVYTIQSPLNGAIVGTSSDVNIQIANVGSILDSVEIHWQFNGTLQPTYFWKKSPGLNFGEISSVFKIGNVTPTSGENTFVIWTQSPNASLDGNLFNDTLKLSIVSCDSALHGNYTVGTPSSDFKTMKDVLGKLANCMISGPVVFELAPGTYSEIDLRASISGSSAVNTVTFTSSNGKASSVVIGSNAESAVLLKNINHLRFINVTIGTLGTGNSYGVRMEGSCENIQFYKCNIYANNIATGSTTAAVYYPNVASKTIYLKDISFIKNNISGGYYNIYLYYPGGDTVNMRAQSVKRSIITIDSNVLSEAYYYGIYSYYYGYFPSISNNQITNRSSSTSFYALYLYYCTVDTCTKNKIKMTNTSAGYGIYTYYLSRNAAYGAAGPCLMSNNEIIGIGGTAKYGFYRNNGQLNFINNSIYLCGTSTNYGIYLGSSVAAEGFKGYNNIVITNGSGTTNYPIYTGTANYVRTSYNVNLDYNVYYSSTNTIGYAAAAVGTLATWKSTYAQDTNTVDILPNFINSNVDLSLLSFDNILICNRYPYVNTDINNDIRTILTIRGAYATPLFEGYDLALESFAEPLVGAVECFPDFTPVKIMLYNQGVYTAKFSNDSVVLHFSCVSDSVNVQSTIVINTDSLLAMNKRVYEVYPLLNILYPGTYHLKVWMECVRDEQALNDTLILDYYVEKSMLPYDNNFSWVGAGIAVNQIYGDIEWKLDKNPPIAPVYGNQSMLFSSSKGKGSISQSLFPSVSLQGTYHPRMQFWYLHDNANPTLRDQMEVKISLDGGATFTVLKKIYRYNAAYTTPTWVPYQIDLSNYTQGTCIIISFVAYSCGGGDQAIDRIRIVAAQDMQLTMIHPDFSTFNACDLTNKSISAVMENLTNQPIPYHSGDSITVKISGVNPRIIKYPLVGKLEGLSKDTIDLANDIDFSISGLYDISVYANAIDSIQTNDSDFVSYTFKADLRAMEILPIGNKNVGDTVFPTIKFKNVGTIPVLSPITLKYTINGKDTVSEIFIDTLQVGDSVMYTFLKGFIVPIVSATQPYYFLNTQISLPCDNFAANDKNQFLGSVSFKDMSISDINYPTFSTYLKAKTPVFVEAYIYNNGTFNSDGAKIHVRVDSAGIPIDFNETSVAVQSGSTILHTFTKSYEVPVLSKDSMPYTLTVYLEATQGDLDLSNDTIRIQTYALNDVGIDELKDNQWYMGQNQPNPAQTLTKIPYSVPQEGQVNIKIMTVSGQILVDETQSVKEGSHFVTINTDNLSNGIYYYSMEFNGETIVKKMTIQK